jgi:putative transcriptional regulator
MRMSYARNGCAMRELSLTMPRAGPEVVLRRILFAFIALLMSMPGLSLAQSAPAVGEGAVFLVAHPAFRDLDYRQSVLIVTAMPNGGHVGVIVNRPTRRSLTSLFPAHEPSKKVADPVFYGGPFSRGALVALVKTETTPAKARCR